MKRLVLALMLSACSTMPRYAVSVDNNQALKILSVINGEFVSLNQPVKFSSSFRLMRSIEPAVELTIPQFISKAFNGSLYQSLLFIFNTLPH